MTLTEPFSTKGAVKKDEQVKFYVPSDLMRQCSEVFEQQGVKLSEGMTRLVRLLVEAPDELKPLLLGQAHGSAALALAEAIIRESTRAKIEVPRPVYDSIAARAAFEGHPDVPTFLAKVATAKTFVLDEPEPNDAADGINSPASSTRAPSEMKSVAAHPRGKARRRSNPVP